MTNRLDRYLKGELDRMALTPDERADADVLERVIGETAAFLDSQPVPDLTERVMRSVGHTRPSPASQWSRTLQRTWAILWTSRRLTIRFRPAYGLVVAAVLVTVLVLRPGIGPAGVIAPEAARLTAVQFRLQAADASDVRLAGSFTNWEATHELHESAPGLWTIVLLLPPGVHEYAFVLDGNRWVSDPYAPAVSDGFGGANSRLVLLPPDDMRS